MYYLLENEKIVDSEDIRHFEEDGYLKTLDTFFEEIKIIGKIKKQSENVYDLIDWEKDLVRVDNMIHQCKYFHRDLREEYIENKWFNTIYKPDEKRNYIKVWEVKEDES